MLGVEAETVQALAVGVLGALAVLAVVAVKVIVSGTMRLVALLVLVGLGVAVWTQRQALQDCADEVQAEGALALAGDARSEATCTFFGVEVTVELPDP